VIDEAASSLYWMAIEYNLGLVAGALSGLRPLFSRLGLFGSTNEKSYMTPNNNFSPSYQLGDYSSKNWKSKASSSKARYKGESVLDITVAREGSPRESDEARIVKTQEFAISEEYHENGNHGTLKNWGSVKESKYV
jgi:hypothetical protein